MLLCAVEVVIIVVVWFGRLFLSQSIHIVVAVTPSLRWLSALSLPRGSIGWLLFMLYRLLFWLSQLSSWVVVFFCYHRFRRPKKVLVDRRARGTCHYSVARWGIVSISLSSVVDLFVYCRRIHLQVVSVEKPSPDCKWGRIHRRRRRRPIRSLPVPFPRHCRHLLLLLSRLTPSLEKCWLIVVLAVFTNFWLQLSSAVVVDSFSASSDLVTPRGISSVSSVVALPSSEESIGWLFFLPYLLVVDCYCWWRLKSPLSSSSASPDSVAPSGGSVSMSSLSVVDLVLYRRYRCAKKQEVDHCCPFHYCICLNVVLSAVGVVVVGNVVRFDRCAEGRYPRRRCHSLTFFGDVASLSLLRLLSSLRPFHEGRWLFVVFIFIIYRIVSSFLVTVIIADVVRGKSWGDRSVLWWTVVAVNHQDCQCGCRICPMWLVLAVISVHYRWR